MWTECEPWTREDVAPFCSLRHCVSIGCVTGNVAWWVVGTLPRQAGPETVVVSILGNPHFTWPWISDEMVDFKNFELC